MMKWKNRIVYGCCALLLTASLTACSGGSATKESSTDNSVNAAENSNSTNKSDTASMVFGKVTAINGSEITLALGDMPQGGGMPGGMGGGPKGDGPSGAPQNDETKGDRPSGIPQNDEAKGNRPSGAPQNDEAKGNRPSGDMPRGMGGAFKENGETLTITIEDESLIGIQNGRETSTGTLSDIVVDSFLIIEYADDKTISAVIIQNWNMEAPNNSENMDAPQNNENDTTKNETEEAQ